MERQQLKTNSLDFIEPIWNLWGHFHESNPQILKIYNNKLQFCGHNGQVYVNTPNPSQTSVIGYDAFFLHNIHPQPGLPIIPSYSCLVCQNRCTKTWNITDGSEKQHMQLLQQQNKINIDLVLFTIWSEDDIVL